MSFRRKPESRVNLSFPRPLEADPPLAEKRESSLWIFFAFFFIVFSSLPKILSARQKSSTSFMDSRNAITGGGTRKTSTSYRLDSAIGEINITTHTSTTYRVRSGVLNVYYYPGTIGNLSASTGPYAGGLTLSWYAPGADGSTGTAKSYVVKWSSGSGIDTQAVFEATTTYSQSWTPLSPTSTETRVLTGFPRDTTIYIRIEARDNDRNQAFLSNQISTQTPAAVVAITISPTSYAFGDIDLGSSPVNTDAIVISNTGNVAEDYTLRATTATTNTPWSLSTSTNPATDSPALLAGMHATRPSSATFAAEDLLTVNNQTASTTKFSIDGSTTGANVDISNNRNLWFNLRMPLVTSTTSAQAFTVTVTAAEAQ